jgi:hypothetical protein
MNKTDEIIIPLSKSKLTLLMLGSIIFVGAGLWFLISPPEIKHPIFGNSTLIFSAGLASIIFFGLMTFFYAKKLPDNKPGLIIGTDGIIDNSSGIAAGLIKWTDLENISVIEIHRQKLIMLFVKNPQDYIDRQTNGFQRKAMQMNYKMYKTPLSITSNGLKCNFSELLELLESNLKINKP